MGVERGRFRKHSYALIRGACGGWSYTPLTAGLKLLGYFRSVTADSEVNRALLAHPA